MSDRTGELGQTGDSAPIPVSQAGVDIAIKPTLGVGQRVRLWLAAWKTRLAVLGSVDLRSLAILRIALGLILLWDLIDRSRWLTAHYTDSGILPRSILIETEGVRGYLSLHCLSGSVLWQAALFGAAGYFALTLLLGIRTRLATAASWLLLLSLHHRNPVILQAGDTLLRLLLFWGMMLPLGARWSVDSVSGPLALCHRKDNRLLSVAGVAILLQVCLVYWFTAAFKDHPMWWHHNAAYYALRVDQLVTPFGMWLRELEWLLPWLTWGVFGLAVAAPLLAFCPVWTGTTRLCVIAAMIGMHLAMAMCLNLGLLPYVAAASWLVFIPTQAWDRLRIRFRKQTGLRARAPRVTWAVAVLRWLPWVVSGSRRGTGDVLIDIPASRQAGIRARNWEQVVASIALLYVIAWNLQSLDANRDTPLLPAGLASFGDVLMMDQSWNMISPKAEALDYDGWFVMPATLADGTKIDAFTRGPITWSNPIGLYEEHEMGARWRRFLRNLARPEFAHYLHPFAEYLARRHDLDHNAEKRIESFQIIFIREQEQPDGRVILTRNTLLEYHHGP